MSEVARRSGKATAKALIGNVVEKGLAALLVSQGLDPAESMVSASVGKAFAEEGIDWVAAWHEERERRIHVYAETLESLSEGSATAMLNETMGNPDLLELLVRTVDTAARSRTDEKIRILASVYAHCADDPAMVDEALIMTDVLGQLEVTHLRILRVLDQDPPSYQFPDGGSRGNVWVDVNIAERAPGLTPVLDALLAKLVSLGMVRESSEYIANVPVWKITSFGARTCRFLESLGPNEAE